MFNIQNKKDYYEFISSKEDLYLLEKKLIEVLNEELKQYLLEKKTTNPFS